MKEISSVKGLVTIRERRWRAPSWARLVPFNKTTKVQRLLRRFGTYDEWAVISESENLLTNGGRDLFHAQCYTNTAAGTIGANYVGLTTDTGAPAAGDTTLASELTTNGMARKQGTITHTAGTNTSQFVVTWTATGSVTAVQKAGSFNASSSGTLAHENTFTSTNLAVNDQLQLTWTFTLG